MDTQLIPIPAPRYIKTVPVAAAAAAPCETIATTAVDIVNNILDQPVPENFKAEVLQPIAQPSFLSSLKDVASAAAANPGWALPL